MGLRPAVITALCVALAGCGTTKWTNTGRSATEQLLISDAMDHAVSQLDFRALAGKTVYLDDEPLQSSVDSAYLISTLRQHMLASGCVLKDKEADADYIVEARAGAVGTDLNELMYGVPRVEIPALIPVSGFSIPPSLPEIKLITRTDQRAVVKVAVFAYNRQTGRPVWQSGVAPTESTAKNFWVFGAGPFQRGRIYGGTSFAGDKLHIPLINLEEPEGGAGSVSVADEAYFTEPKRNVAQGAQPAESSGNAQAPKAANAGNPPGAEPKVIPAGLTQPGAPATSAQPPAAPSPPLDASPDAPPAAPPAQPLAQPAAGETSPPQVPSAGPPPGNPPAG
jgi:hypothetical protein